MGNGKYFTSYNANTADWSELTTTSGHKYVGKCSSKDCINVYKTRQEWSAKANAMIEITTLEKEHINGITRATVFSGGIFPDCHKCGKELIWRRKKVQR